MVAPLTVSAEDVSQAKAAADASVIDPVTSKTSDGSQPVVELPEFLKGQISEEEFQALPEKARQTLTEQSKRLVGDYTKKSQEVAELRRVKDDLDADPDKAEHLRKAMAEYDAIKSGVIPAKATPSQTEAEKSRLEKMLSVATPEQKSAITELIDALDERYQGDRKAKEAEIGELKRQLKLVVSDTQLTRQEKLSQDLASLPVPVKALAEKYEAQILRLGAQSNMGKVSAEKLLQIVSTPEEYRQAILASAPEQAKKQVEKARQTATAKPSATVGVAETFTEADKVKAPNRNYGNSWNLSKVVGKMVQEVRRSLPGT